MGLFKSPLQALYQQTDRGFAGGVSRPGAPMPEIPRTHSGRVKELEVRTGNSDASTSSNIVARLLHVSPISPALKKKRDELVAYLLPLLDEAQQLEKVLIEHRQKTLESQLVELRSRCRKQAGVVKSLRGKLDSDELSLLNCMAGAENETKILQGLRDLKAEGRHIPRWPTQDEIEAFESSYADQQAKVVTANERVATALNVRNEAMHHLEPAQKTMERLIGEEARLKSEVNKTPFIDLELGLESTPSGFTKD